MTEFLSYVIRGVPIGCVYALVAVGLVLTYKTSGVFNLAYGAQAFVSGVVFYNLRHHGLTLFGHQFGDKWGVIPAAVVAIVVIGPLLGLLLDGLLFRFLRTSSALAKLVTSLGLLIAIPAVVQLVVGQTPLVQAPGLAPGNSGGAYPGSQVPTYHFGSFYWDQNQLITIVATVAVAVGLSAMFRWTTIGLRMRAVAESPRMSQLSGVRAERVSGFSWMLSGFLAGLTGVLIAPLFGQVLADFYFALLVAAIAACVFGRLSSIPLTFLGGLLLGAIEQIFSGYLPHNSVLFTGLRPSLPFVILALLLLFWPGLRRRRGADDPLAGVDPPPPSPVAASRPAWAAVGTRIAAGAALVAMVVLVLFVLNGVWVSRITEGVIYAVIFLSITIVTGWSGQISLCQATFAGIGGFTVGQLVSNFNTPVLLAILGGMALAAVVGAVVALPALRLAGIYVALATLAFALLFDNVLAPLSWVGGAAGKPVSRPFIGSIDFSTPVHDRAFFVLCLIVLALASGAVFLIQRGTSGRFFDAVRGSERAATSVGINPVRVKIAAFTVSGALAGLGGGLLATDHTAATPTDYVYLLGLFWVLIVVTIGSRSIFAAIIGGLSFTLIPEILNTVGISNQLLWTEIGFAFGAITYVKHPEGLLEYNTRSVIAFVDRMRGRRSAPPPRAEAAAPTAVETMLEPTESR